MTRQDIMNHHRQTMQAVCAFIVALSLVVMVTVTFTEPALKQYALETQESSVKW